MHSKNNKTMRILMAFAALLLIFSIGISTTYSWIEGGTTYSIQTEHEDDVKSAVLEDDFDNKIMHLSATSSLGQQDLLQWDRTTGTPANSEQIGANEYIYSVPDARGIVFSPVSSVNGETFFLPTAYGEDGKPVKYREATTNDIGTKYINFDFDVKADEKCYLAFSGAPTAGSFTENKKAFRIMVTDGITRHIFSGDGTVISSNAVKSIDSSGKPTMEAVATELASEYQKINTTLNRLFSFESGDSRNIEVSIWLESELATEARYGDVAGINVGFVVDNPKYFYKVDAVTQDKDGNKTTSSFVGGTIKHNGTNVTSTLNNASCIEGSTVTLVATPKDGYKFVGWYTDAACTQLVPNSAATITVKPTASGGAYYALFEELGLQTTTIYAEPRNGFSTYSIWAYQKVGSTTTQYSGSTWPGESAVYDSATTYYKYTFDTTDTGNFNVILSNNGGSQYPASGSEGLVGEIGGTYLFTADNQLIEFDPSTMFTFKVQSNMTECPAYINSSGTTSVKLRPGQSVNINATVPAGYTFDGWFTSTTYTVGINSKHTTLAQTVTPTGSSGSTVVYYAKFTKVATTDYYFDTSAVSWYNDDSPTLAVSVDGGVSWILGTKVTYNSITYWKVSVPTGTSSFMVSRYFSASQQENKLTISVSGSNNMCIFNSGYTNEPCWVTYEVGKRLVFFEASSCSWFTGDDAIAGVSPTGGTSNSNFNYTTAITYAGKTYYYYNLPSGTTSFRVGRKLPNGNVYNHFSVSLSGTNDLYKINSNSTGGSWSNFLH